METAASQVCVRRLLLFTFWSGFILSVLSLTSPNVDDPVYSLVVENHAKKSLTKLPALMNSMVTFIDMKNNHLELLTDHMFSNFTELLKVDLESNNIQMIEPNAFKDTQVEILLLNDNDINGSFPDFCRINNTLKYVKMQDNMVTTVPNLTLACLSHLLFLDLIRNPLIQFPIMADLPNAYQFDTLGVSGTYFTINGPLPLDGLDELRSLYLHDVGNSSFPDLSLLPVANSLKKLSVNYNNFTEITTAAIAGLGRLRLRTLLYPKIDNVLMQVASTLFRLNTLMIWQSSDEYMVIPKISNLRGISIRYSGLTSELPDISANNNTLVNFHCHNNTRLSPSSDDIIRKLSPMLLLQELIIHANNMTSLPDLRPILPNLATLKLSSNPWHCDCNITWLLEVGRNDSGITIVDFEWDDLRCASPSNLMGRRFNTLSIEELVCNEEVMISETTSHITEASGAASTVTIRTPTELTEISSMGYTRSDTTYRPHTATVTTKGYTTYESTYQSLATSPDTPTVELHNMLSGCYHFLRRTPSTSGGVLLDIHSDLTYIGCLKLAIEGNAQSFFFNKANGSCVTHTTIEPAWTMESTDWMYYLPSYD